jgi:hypothetical protein
MVDDVRERQVFRKFIFNESAAATSQFFYTTWEWGRLLRILVDEVRVWQALRKFLSAKKHWGTFIGIFGRRFVSGADTMVIFVNDMRVGQARLDYCFTNGEWGRLFWIFFCRSDSGAGTILLLNFNLIL